MELCVSPKTQCGVMYLTQPLHHQDLCCASSWLATHGNCVTCGPRPNQQMISEQQWAPEVRHAGPLACGHALVPTNH
ncbi:hypothetical protein Pmani_003932 [Petrolisthes manimaculis]|uniref:Uncharacterized protein n=1 Tax=Petrolisthes manimaculis TaxID=1843537 RepID=A0AAE1QFL4_9EUCA|nr:hypothetical protein Pmani_003932 [Petrolisthes manimaculis]